MKDMQELQPIYEKVKSYYRKAHVMEEGNSIKLYSYGTLIASIKDHKMEVVYDLEKITQTTLRHLKEFMQQNEIEVLTKKELIKKYS